jgi:hypothetical protein
MMPQRFFSVWAVGLLLLAGCNSPLIRSQSPEVDDLEEIADREERDVQFIGDMAVPAGMNFLTVHGVALVNGLDGTGSDPPPGPLRSALISEMQTHEVRSPHKLLQSDTNALVVVKGHLPPGVRKGDRFDVEVILPSKTKAESLENGFLMQTRLREMRMLDNTVHSGHVAALAGGNVFVDAIFKGKEDSVLKLKRRVLGGGESRISRPLSLVLRTEHSSVRTSAAIGAAINARFHRMDRVGKSGVATPKQDNYVELVVHPRYKNNISRYMRVIRSIAIRESQAERAQRIELLARRLVEPTTAARAALELEAIGDESVRILKTGLASSDPEVQFYSAEALAYLDCEAAAKPLADAARDEPAFRWHALTALSTMDHVEAYEALTDLLHVPSAETRYGAFRALRTRNPDDPLVRGEALAGDFIYHMIPSNGPPMVHFSMTRSPEVVLFGHNQKMIPPAFLFAGREIMVKGLQNGQMRVSHFQAGQPDEESLTVDANTDAMIRAIAQMGGGYAEVLQAVTEAKNSGYLDSKVVINALARPNRSYRRSTDEEAPADEEEPRFRVANPLPEMFSNRLGAPERRQRTGPDEYIEPDPAEQDESDRAFMSKMTDWLPLGRD